LFEVLELHALGISAPQVNPLSLSHSFGSAFLALFELMSAMWEGITFSS